MSYRTLYWNINRNKIAHEMVSKKISFWETGDSRFYSKTCVVILTRQVTRTLSSDILSHCFFFTPIHSFTWLARCTCVLFICSNSLSRHMHTLRIFTCYKSVVHFEFQTVWVIRSSRQQYLQLYVYILKSKKKL